MMHCTHGAQVNNWRDLLNDEPFKRKDLITIQDPTDLERHNLTKFHHLKHNLKVSSRVLLACGSAAFVYSATEDDLCCACHR